MEKIDFKKSLKSLYAPAAKDFAAIDVPGMMFVKVDGEGDPNTALAYKTALEWLYSVSYGMKFAAKAALGKNYVVPPLEGLWWADGHAVFRARQKDKWKWTMMIMVPDFVTRALYEAALAKAGKTLGARPESLRLEVHDEGLCLQILHIGSYDDETPTLKRLHEEVIPGRGFVESGPHHEIYLSDPRKVEPAKLRTILRQPVKRREWRAA